MRFTASLILTLFTAVAAADSVLIPSPQAEIVYTASVTDDHGYYTSSGNVRSGLPNGFDAEMGAYRIETRFEEVSADEYAAEIFLGRRDGRNWREIDGERFTFAGRFGVEVEETFHYSDATLDLEITVSQVMLNIDVDPAPESNSGVWLLPGVLAMLLTLALIVLYLRR